MNTIISNKVHHYSLLLELDDEMKDWFENQLDKGKYLEHLIIEDRERQNYPETDEVHGRCRSCAGKTRRTDCCPVSLRR